MKVVYKKKNNAIEDQLSKKKQLLLVKSGFSLYFCDDFLYS